MKLIIDTDPGVDDALAIALAVAWPTVDLVGLTTVFGNTFVPQSSRNARYLLDLFGHECAVAEGAALPWGADSYDPADEVHGPEGLGARTVIPQIGQNASEDAADFLIRMARADPGEVTVCAIGPLTNIADALQRDPDFLRNLKQLVIMGGAYRHAGNITPFAEANVFHDAAAADVVFAAEGEILMIGLDATMQTLLTPADLADMAVTAPRVGGFLREIHDFYQGFYRSVGVTTGCPMHDATAILACIAPERFTFEMMGLRIETEGVCIGRTVADPSRAPVHIAVGVEARWAVQTAKVQVATFD